MAAQLRASHKADGCQADQNQEQGQPVERKSHDQRGDAAQAQVPNGVSTIRLTTSPAGTENKLEQTTEFG
ncbi:MAG: hypothetical protein ISS57_06850 [Anaerolineales bacterium]|nr:hypothetical protein [Anaerolineales bacterium]